ncbi:hypothetical protein ACIBM4_26480 [Streptomyces sp. NPDC050256]|uniref:DUF7660 family protein n=1 Tax=Streptomyces sp. NPDC050256 TaxID=3365607 RepID=UPI0037BA071F
MSRFYDVRGHLACEFGDLERIRQIVDAYAGRGEEFGLSERVAQLYCSGWLYQQAEINWVAHAFFGASVKRGGVDLVRDQLENIAGLVTDVEGAFFVDDDEGGQSECWKVTGGRLKVFEREGPSDVNALNGQSDVGPSAGRAGSLDGVEPVRSREELAAFLRSAADDLARNPGAWENASLESFLGAWAAWLDDMPGWYGNQGKDVPDRPDYQLIADMVMAARIYE